MAKKKTSTDLEELEDRFKAYERYYNQLHEDQKEIDTYYELTFDPNVPSDYPTRMPPTARDWVDVGVRHFTLDNPKAKVFARKDNESAREQVEKLETFYNFWLRKDIRQIKRGAKKLLKRGELFIKLNMDDTYFGTNDPNRLFHFPFYMTMPDPINVYCNPAHDGLVPLDVFEYFELTVAEADWLAKANGWKWERKDKGKDKFVKWKSYYSADERCFWLDEETVLDPPIQKNILGFVPYVHIDAGYGDDSYEGKPEYLYRSLLWAKKDMIKLDARILSTFDAINQRFGWPRYTAVLSDVAAAEELKKLYPGGQVPTDPSKWWYQVKDRVELQIMEGANPPPGLLEEYSLIHSLAQAPEVLSGIRPLGVYSGQHQETLLQTAKPLYKDPFKNYEDGLGVTMGMGARTAEKVYKYDIQIKNFASEDKREYRKITPDDINGHYDCEVQLLAEPPEATDMRKYLGANLRKGGSISEKTELKNYHDMSEKEAMDEMAQKWAERGLGSVGALDVMAKDAMSRLGMDRELEILEEAEQNAAKNIPPPKEGEGVAQGGERVRGRISPELEGGPMETKVGAL